METHVLTTIASLVRSQMICNLWAPVSFAKQTVSTTIGTPYRATIWYMWDRGSDWTGNGKACYLQWSVNQQDKGPRIVVPQDAPADSWELWTVDWVADRVSSEMVWNIYCPDTGSDTTAVEVLFDAASVVQTCPS